MTYIKRLHNSLFLFICIQSVSGQIETTTKLSNIEMAYPFWTPDGKNILFQSNWAGNLDLFIMEVESKNIKQLTFEESDQITPAVSPDGNFIAYVSNQTGKNQLYLMDIMGENKQQLTMNEGVNLHPYWHPSERKLIFNSTMSTPKLLEVFIMDLPTKEISRLTSNEVHDSYASWSPDGKKIAFIRWNEDENGGDIFTMDTETQITTQITSHEKFDGWPNWYSNEELIFSSYRVEPKQLFKINIETNEVIQLTDTDEENARANTLKNKVLYNGLKNGSMNIYVMEL